MPTPKLFVRQYKDDKGNIYMIHRYWDNHLNNYEYQVYQLVIAKQVARNLGCEEIGNTRQMCDWVWDNAEPYDGEYRQANEDD